MSVEPNHHKQYQHERAYARFRRAQQGRTTDLDRAEDWHEKLWQMLIAARFYAPLGISLVIALASGATLMDCGAVIMWALGANAVAVITSGIGERLFGDGFGEFVHNAVMTLSGVTLICISGSVLVLAVIGAVMAASPTVWWFLVRPRMRATNYVRLMRQAAVDDDDVAPRIIE